MPLDPPDAPASPILEPARLQNHPPLGGLPVSFYVNVKLCHVDFAIAPACIKFDRRRIKPTGD